MTELIQNGGKYINWNRNYIMMPNGDVFSIRRNKWLKKSVDRGYFVVTVGKTVRCCRLVAIHYVPNPLKRKVVNHLDGDKTNDHYSNLEWCTNSENITHAHRMGLMKYPNNIGRKHSKETKRKMSEARKRYYQKSLTDGKI